MANQKFFFPGPPASGEAMWFLQHGCSGGLPDRSSTLPKVPVPSQQSALPVGVGLSGVWWWATLCRVRSYPSKRPPFYGPELARKGKAKGHLPGKLKASSVTGPFHLLICPYVFHISSLFSCLSHIFSPFTFIATRPLRHKWSFW